ncbi:membrane protein YqaA with SNARE-associated domain [Pseudorhizobium tarimense]|uniref:Membrane protein YqaA with SNARE-associated domain n=1 Tax=Pseudorhizobium tarimense TaxID=1079109 RepID=A0ABV2H8G6_9HYPH|nr:YqaA family protein [Pseudorhizobium tarimense]MCJ8519868.1 DedA family protein [Pseudorhizobium tarimense]
MLDIGIYGGLFAAAFLAATILPMQSEAILVSLILAGNQPVWALVLTASFGNMLGAVVNWALGRGIERFRHHRWFPVSEQQLERAERWYHRFGRWSLLLSWLPIGGDALTVVAGVLREPLATFVLLVLAGKAARYVVLAAATHGLL